MPLVFTPCSGVVEVKQDWCGTDAYFTLKVDGQTLKGIATGVEIEMSGNYQFLHTVNNFIYFYAFGDRVGTINVTGIGFVKNCEGKSAKSELLQLYDYYIQKRAAANGKKSATLTISGTEGGTKTFRGFLTGMRMDIKATETMGTVGYWTFRFEVVPTTKSSGSGLTYGFGTGVASAGAGAITI